jgi:hypothetical protein
MATKFSDYATAAKMRDVMQRTASIELEKQRPRIQYGTVSSIDRPNRKATVLLPGDTNPITVGMGVVQPSATTQVVRIDGPPNDRYITDVMGAAQMIGVISGTVPAAQVTAGTFGVGSYVITGTLTANSLAVNGVSINGTAGRNFFKDNELSSGSGLRVGAAYGWYGIYSESGDVVIGSVTGLVRMNNEGTFLDSNGWTVKSRNYMGQSGAYGGNYAQFSHSGFWNSGGSYGLMQLNDGQVYLSGSNVWLRNANNDRMLIAGDSVDMYKELNLRGFKIWNKAYADDNHRAQYASDTDGWYLQGWGGIRLYYAASGRQISWDGSGLYTNVGWGLATHGLLNSAVYGASTGGALMGSNNGNIIRFYWDGGFRCVVDVTTVKTFVIDHPQYPENKHLVHACLEGPEAAVYYRGEAQLVDGWVEIKLPDYFEKLTRKEGRSVQLTCIADDPADEWCPVLHATRPKNGKFFVGLGSGMHITDQRFWWQVTAVRKDVPRLLVEPKKEDVTVMGEGPYTYYTEN